MSMKRCLALAIVAIVFFSVLVIVEMAAGMPSLLIHVLNFVLGCVVGWKSTPWLFNETDIIFGVKWRLEL